MWKTLGIMLISCYACSKDENCFQKFFFNSLVAIEFVVATWNQNQNYVQSEYNKL